MKSIVSIILLLICLVFVESGIESVKKIIEKTFHRKNQNYLTNQKNSDFSMNQFFSHNIQLVHYDAHFSVKYYPIEILNYLFHLDSKLYLFVQAIHVQMSFPLSLETI